MINVVFAVGNSDNKLTQEEWATFLRYIRESLTEIHTTHGRSLTIYNEGYSWPGSPWQNAIWWINVDEDTTHHLKARLADLAAYYRQDGIAWKQWSAEQTEFIEATPTS